MPHERYAGSGLSSGLLEHLIAEHDAAALPRLTRLWDYYRNPESPARAGSPWTRDARPRLAQEQGLPRRIVGPGTGDPALDDRLGVRREAVVENDIAWRIHSMVDFMFGKPVLITSTARDESLRRTIERVLDAVWEASGGIALLQDMALLGHVYGHADLLVRAGEELFESPLAAIGGPDDPAIDAAAEAVRVEVVEPTRAIPVLNPGDYRALDAYVIRVTRTLNEVELAPSIRSVLASVRGRVAPAGRRRTSEMVEVFVAGARRVYIDGRLVHEAADRSGIGGPPVAHIQNVSQPFRWEGLGEVEPLVPLQDELNTRLSDRANRVTLQSFKMYLAKGIDGFEKLPVGPGQIVSTDNPDASIEAFGGDADSPSERDHVGEVREAIDKTSGVPPLASGVVRAKIGNLTSANALRITLMGLLSKTARKRVTYGRGIAQACRMILTALDSAGVLRTEPADRAVKLVWPDPLPEDVLESVAAARAKRELGVPDERVLAELGYAASDPGVT